MQEPDEPWMQPPTPSSTWSRPASLDEAEQAARELLVRYPEVHDGYDRLGMVYEARGQNREAADCYRKVIEFMRAHPEDYDPEFEPTSSNSSPSSKPPRKHKVRSTTTSGLVDQPHGGAPPAAWQGPLLN